MFECVCLYGLNHDEVRRHWNITECVDAAEHLLKVASHPPCLPQLGQQLAPVMPCELLSSITALGI